MARVAQDQPFLKRYLTERDGRYTLAMTLSSGLRGFTKDDIDHVERTLARHVPGFDAEEGGAEVVSFLAGGKILARELRARMKEGYATVTVAAMSKSGFMSRSDSAWICMRVGGMNMGSQPSAISVASFTFLGPSAPI